MTKPITANLSNPKPINHVSYDDIYDLADGSAPTFGVAVHRDVLVIWDEDRDERILQFIDELPEATRGSLVACREHKGRLSLLWKFGTRIPSAYANGSQVELFVLLPGIDAADCWDVHSSYCQSERHEGCWATKSSQRTSRDQLPPSYFCERADEIQAFERDNAMPALEGTPQQVWYGRYVRWMLTSQVDEVMTQGIHDFPDQQTPFGPITRDHVLAVRAGMGSLIDAGEWIKLKEYKGRPKVLMMSIAYAIMSRDDMARKYRGEPVVAS